MGRRVADAILVAPEALLRRLRGQAGHLLDSGPYIGGECVFKECVVQPGAQVTGAPEVALGSPLFEI